MNSSFGSLSGHIRAQPGHPGGHCERWQSIHCSKAGTIGWKVMSRVPSNALRWKPLYRPASARAEIRRGLRIFRGTASSRPDAHDAMLLAALGP
nr:hypothetical protein CFP56_53698 [Quercus suber]